MEVVTPMLGVAFLFSSSVAAPPPLDPLPPNANSYGYNYGAQDTGEAGSSGRAPVAPSKENHANMPQEPGPPDCQKLKKAVQVVCSSPSKSGEVAKLSPAELALSRWARMPIPKPVVRTAPPRRRGGLVGLPEWFWVTNWRPLGGRVAARGVWVELTARPQSMAIDPGSGEAGVRCSGPGTAYDKSRSATSQHTDCSHTFARSSLNEPGRAYRVRVTVVWGGSWHGSDGSGGGLPPLSRSTTVRLRVAEGQALYG